MALPEGKNIMGSRSKPKNDEEKNRQVALALQAEVNRNLRRSVPRPASYLEPSEPRAKKSKAPVFDLSLKNPFWDYDPFTRHVLLYFKDDDHPERDGSLEWQPVLHVLNEMYSTGDKKGERDKQDLMDFVVGKRREYIENPATYLSDRNRLMWWDNNRVPLNGCFEEYTAFLGYIPMTPGDSDRASDKEFIVYKSSKSTLFPDGATGITEVSSLRSGLQRLGDSSLLAKLDAFVATKKKDLENAKNFYQAAEIMCLDMQLDEPGERKVGDDERLKNFCKMKFNGEGGLANLGDGKIDNREDSGDASGDD